MDLQFSGAPKDLMTNFVNCLVQLPNLRILDILGTDNTKPMKQALKMECARFPGIRELWVGNELVEFVGNCPNLESVTVIGSALWSAEILHLHGKRLRRVAGVYKDQIQSGELRVPLGSGVSTHRGCLYGSCGGLSRPPRDLYQG